MNDENEIVMVANLTDAETRALLVLIEVGSREIKRKLEAGEYQHECQRMIAEGVLARADSMTCGISRVLSKRDGRTLQ